MSEDKRMKVYLKGLKKKKIKGIELIKRDEKIELWEERPNCGLFILHYSEGSEDDYHVLRSHLLQYGPLSSLIILSGINYGYACYESLESAAIAYETINNSYPILPFSPKPHPFTVLYTPIQHNLQLGKDSICYENVPVPGLIIEKDFISAEYEQLLVEELDKLPWNPLANRRVQHFGFDFIYGANSINPETPSSGFPAWINPLLTDLQLKFGISYDQLTVNDYQPGDSIPPHIDSHSPFEEILACISILGPISMCFRNTDGREFNQFIPPRSMLAMTDEARYVWKHSIQQRRHDIVNGNLVHRKRRISLTFRKIRIGPCRCKYPEFCDRDRYEEGSN
ncbi:unnamed protein product [Blepharisma stoltei]|uniref:Fe2OG dioxygenase domain-containing protein n=1 Tax=Blepharisma stoltei TaxID=1481888 RepID=A0AAU9K304_9CILI|nr:unnamed protein product [Blepharisma stoltei]